MGGHSAPLHQPAGVVCPAQRLHPDRWRRWSAQRQLLASQPSFGGAGCRARGRQVWPPGLVQALPARPWAGGGAEEGHGGSAGGHRATQATQVQGSSGVQNTVGFVTPSSYLGFSFCGECFSFLASLFFCFSLFLSVFFHMQMLLRLAVKKNVTVVCLTSRSVTVQDFNVRACAFTLCNTSLRTHTSTTSSPTEYPVCQY